MAGTCYLNGKAVGIGKEVCQADPNTTWVEDGGQQPTQDNRNFLQRAGSYIAENPLEVASYGLVGLGPLGLAAKGGQTAYRAFKAGDALKGRAGKLMDRLFRKEGTPANPGFTMPQGVNQMARNTGRKGGVNMRTSNPTPLTGGATEASRVLRRPSPLAVAGTAGGVGGMGLLNYATRDERLAQEQAIQKQQLDQVMASQKAFDTAKSKEAADKAEAERVAGLNPMERIMENLKKPGFLTDPLIPGGPPSYNRLNKLGMLMNYYGSTPKQRAQMTDPSKQFAAIEKGVMDNATALAKAQATLKSQYGKPTVSNLADGMFDLVKDAYGGTWLPFDDKSDDELKRISSLAAIRLTELAQDPAYVGIGEEQLRVEAVRQVGEELGL